MSEQKKSTHKLTQLSTFWVANRLYAFDVTEVQEVVRVVTTTPIPKAPCYVAGLINLRGQIATAIGLRELFGLSENKNEDPMSVVCKIGDYLVSFLVDEIGDVIEVSEDLFEYSPPTIDISIRQYMHGVYKTPGDILSVLDIHKIFNFLEQ